MYGKQYQGSLIYAQSKKHKCVIMFQQSYIDKWSVVEMLQTLFDNHLSA